MTCVEKQIAGKPILPITLVVAFHRRRGIVTSQDVALKGDIMHIARWGLEKAPFSTIGTETVFYAGLPQQEALARLRYLVHNQRRLGLMLGGSGHGKSLVLALFAEEAQARGWNVASADLLGASVHEFYWSLATELAAGPRAGDDTFKLMRRVEHQLQRSRLEECKTILLFDDTDQAGPDIVTQLARLVQMPVDRVGDLTVVLAADSTQGLPISQRILNLVDLRIDLEPWDADDTTGFLQLALVAAGAEQPIFDEHALAEIHRLTGGVPRRVSRLADYALAAGSSAGLELIDAQTVADAYATINHR